MKRFVKSLSTFVNEAAEAPVTQPAPAPQAGAPAPTGGVEIPRRLSAQEIKDWNQFVDWVKAKGYQGSTELDTNHALVDKLFNDFKTEFPNTTVNQTVVKPAQYEMLLLQQNARDFDARHGAPNSTIMAGISKLDGWFGSRTSSFKFPDLVITKPNQPTTVAKNMGPINGDGRPGAQQQALGKVPPGAQLYKDSNGRISYTNADGDVVYIN